ncbi:hypothetical protein NOX90_02550 [Wolbachia endosymbiont of Anurida maritima]|uniref:hypothetical protein n=1 Tax=Wolbachia endosymbiont of Anurida maritima TaxID=2850562 RepID=UPI0035CEC326
MDEELKKLQDERKLLCEETAELSGKEVDVEQGEVLVKKSEKITETASKIKKLELYKEDIKNLLNGDKVKLRSCPPQYFSILNSGLIEIMEKKLTAYVKGDTDIGETYSSLNNKAEKIKMLRGAELLAAVASMEFFVSAPFVGFLISTIAGGRYHEESLAETYYLYTIAIMLSVAAISLTIAGVVHLANRHYEKSFAKEMQDFIEGPKYVDKATNTEDVKESEQKETKEGELIGLSGDHKEVQPSISSEQSESGMDLLVDLSEQPNSNVDSTLSGVTQVRESNVQLLRGIVIGKGQEIGV